MKVEFGEDDRIFLIPESSFDAFRLRDLFIDRWHLVSDVPEYKVSGVRKHVTRVELKMVPIGEIYF